MSESKKWGPAWFYGPNGEKQIFANEKDVPDGWADSPAAFDAEPATKKPAKAKS